MTEPSIWDRLKPPEEPIFVTDVEEIEEIKIGDVNISSHDVAISLLGDAKDVVALLDDDENIRRIYFHINKAIRILKLLKRQEELKK